MISVVLSLLVGQVSAQGTQVAFGTIQQDTTLPVEVTADNLSVDQSSGTAIFTGNVLIGQGEMRLSAPRVLVVYRATAEGIARLEATGGVTLVAGADAAEAERADYSIDDGTIVMTGNVLLTQGRNALTADKMTVRLSDGTARMSGRVKTILQTGDQ
ncbi:lipopolysaccharide transport periplasmic protein LptA [Sulfitobacter sabulilitoris]|uniref:Lipopolysaccharide transport periplasmic protein LptA n=1 Tax=Sulfitobacter sabulilitoris TaxID=2562655 RepID=A0A5S3PG33_9RHOB|nr:lipopolysaccharide transport periplasmic protein LptA [Sulfitobacter sabulilitoris]TMM53040.1 lipopolysaccharide transport periplasmic protein LptA [Sulfitobacter sabulilitoris]